MTEKKQRRTLFAAYCDCVANRETLTPNGIVDRLLQATAALLEDARNDEREGIACYLQTQGHLQLADEVFAGLTRPVNDHRRDVAIEVWAASRPPKKRSSRKAAAPSPQAQPGL